MKKSIFKISALLLVITLCAVSALALSFAKYKTENSNTDTATVAKWGVTITATGESFSKTEGEGENLSVSSEHEVVAPGMKGNMATVTIEGTPEVAANVTLAAELTLTGWTVGEAEYCPLVFKVGDKTYKIGATVDETTIDDIADLEAAVEGAIASYSKDYKAGTNLGGVDVVLPAVSWEWAFSSSDDNDVKDTALGNAQTKATISFKLDVTITQLDTYTAPAGV